jgi:transposase-like protein
MMKLADLEAKFQTEDDCKSYLRECRWPDGVRCPRCGNAKVWEVKSRPFHWLCKGCNKNGYRFSVISGTIFENTKFPLVEWFKVAFLMYHSKKGMSARQIHRMMTMVSYETAWYMCHRIRAAMQNSAKGQLLGIVEVDETFVGGKAYNRHGGRSGGGRGGIGSGKVPVVGAISRKGKVVARVIDSVSAETLTKFVREAVSDKVELVATDEWTGYRNVKFEFPHAVVRHTAGEYVNGIIHTNTIEGFWSLFKRGIVGTYHKMSKTYMPLYVSEFEFRHNMRDAEDPFREIIARC